MISSLTHEFFTEGCCLISKICGMSTLPRWVVTDLQCTSVVGEHALLDFILSGSLEKLGNSY
jgi:hypothetical protein